MTKARLPTILNFVLPGAGLLYLGRTFDAITNFLIALVVPLLWMLTPDGVESIHYAILVVASGSGGYAHAIATQQANGA